MPQAATRDPDALICTDDLTARLGQPGLAHRSYRPP
jgi:hypothetical protein